MTIEKRPYLIIPYLIEQPTWGGEYICKKKGWLEKQQLKGKKIGQSYELYSKTLLAANVTSSIDNGFFIDTKNTIPVSLFREDKPFPLIKFTQAKGNSFQLHIPQGVTDSHWHPKAESWYFFEKGKITFGIKQGKNMSQYKEVCLLIDAEMKRLSEEIRKNNITREQAEEESRSFIKKQNPWQFVNVHETNKGDSIDLSGGGIHHSWEEDKNNELGNIVFEVQQDEMDPVSTMRSFDQGKFLTDGTVRELQIEDYFKYLDTREEKNILKIQQNDTVIFNTPFYTLKKLFGEKRKEMETTQSFHHLFVKEGAASVRSKNGGVYISQGHSCFIPNKVHYTIEMLEKSELLQTSV